MKFTSPIVSSGSGSIAGLTLSRNRYGMYLRQKAIPVNPNTEGQQAVRLAFAKAVQVWATTLSATDREAWTIYAANVPKRNVMSYGGSATGQAEFIASYTIRLAVGSPSITSYAAPTTYTRSPFTDPVITAASGATFTLSAAFTNTDEWATAAGGFMLFSVGLLQNPSRTFYKGPFTGFGSYKIIGGTVPPTSPASIDVHALDSAVPGQKVWVKTQTITADNRVSIPKILGPFVVQ